MANGIAGARKDIKKLERALRGERERGFKRTARAQDAIFDNLGQFIGQRGRKLTASNRRQLQGIANLSASQRRSSKRLDKQAAQTAADAGLLGGATRQQFAGAQAVAGETQRDLRAARQAGRFGAGTGRGAIAIAQEGAETARAGAEQATADALALRTKEDTALVAQQELQLRMAEIAHEQQMEQLERQSQLRMKEAEHQFELARKETEGAGLGQQEFIVKSMARAMPVIQKILSDDSIPDQPDPESGSLGKVQMARQALINLGMLQEGNEADDAIFGSLISTMMQRNLGKIGAPVLRSDGKMNPVGAGIMSDVLFGVAAPAYQWELDPKQRKALTRAIRAEVGAQFTNAGLADGRAGGPNGSHLAYTERPRPPQRTRVPETAAAATVGRGLERAGRAGVIVGGKGASTTRVAAPGFTTALRNVGLKGVAKIGARGLVAGVATAAGEPFIKRVPGGTQAMESLDPVIQGKGLWTNITKLKRNIVKHGWLRGLIK